MQIRYRVTESSGVEEKNGAFTGTKRRTRVYVCVLVVFFTLGSYRVSIAKRANGVVNKSIWLEPLSNIEIAVFSGIC